MPGRYKLRYLPVAQDDLISISEHIAEDSPSRATGFVEKLSRVARLLEENPLLGRIPLHEELREYRYRVLIVESYLVFYIVRGHTVEVHRVLHASRNLDRLIRHSRRTPHNVHRTKAAPHIHVPPMSAASEARRVEDLARQSRGLVPTQSERIARSKTGEHENICRLAASRPDFSRDPDI